MMAVLKRELKAYFTSVIGWIFLAAFFFVFNLYFVANNMIYGTPYLSYSLNNVAFVLMIIIPILAMRSMADDRRTKTDQLLYTSPVSIPKVIIGKFFALVIVFSIVAGAICLCPVILSRFGSVPIAESYAAILGLWLYGCLSISICVFVSALTESQVIAAVLSFAVLFIGYMMEGITSIISSSGNALTKILNCLSTSTALNNFSNGMLDVTGIIYYVSGTVLFLFLTCQVVQKHRWTVSSKKIRRGVFNSSFVVIGIAIAVAVNVFANQLPEKVKNVDLTTQNLYTLTDDSVNLVKKLKQDVTLYVLSSEKSADDTVVHTLENYTDESSHIKVEYVDPAVSPNFYASYTDTAPSDGSIIVVSGDTSKVVDANDLYDYSVDYSTYTQTKSAYDGEGQLTSAISYVTSEDKPKVYEITGHGETSLDDSFKSALEKMNISVEEITLLQKDAIPDDAAAIIINGPTSDFSADDATKVSNYLAGGGKAVITTSYSKTAETPNFDSILATYDVNVTNGLVMDSDSTHYYQYPFYLLPNVASATQTSKVEKYVFMPYAQPISNSGAHPDTITWTDLLTTSDSAYVKTDIANIKTFEKEDGDQTGSFSIAANITDSETGADITILGSSLAFTNDADSMVSGQNLALFKGITSSFAGSDSAVSIDAKQYTYSTLSVNQSIAIMSETLLVMVLPVALIVIGIVIWYRRRRA
ncbi:Gldg family protein [uncultured Eubacterium sp.]|uniref:Gldg family protein n=1 Tax=uncultured Eubacterium sp. TaxID=165185 RepID=UPI0025E5FAD3|nr:Gldg family protein [uncultured Eubacterium sp.]